MCACVSARVRGVVYACSPVCDVVHVHVCS